MKTTTPINSNCNVVTVCIVTYIKQLKDISDMMYMFGETVYYDTDTNQYRYNTLTYQFVGSDLVEVAKQLKVNQIATVIGYLNTENIVFPAKCTGMLQEEDEEDDEHYAGCGKVVGIENSTDTYIRAGGIIPLPTVYASRDDAREKLRLSFCDVSNNIVATGNVCKAPVIVDMTGTNRNLTVKYAIAMHKPRVYRTMYDSEIMERSSYVYVQTTTDAQAYKDIEHLQVGTIVTVSGRIQFRHVYMQAQCPHCGKVFEYKRRAVEILSTNSTNYLANIANPDTVEEENSIRYITVDI